MQARTFTGPVWVLCFLIAALSMWLKPYLGNQAWIPGASVLALVIGALLVHVPGLKEPLSAPAKSIVKKAIPFAIIMIGFGLNWSELLEANVIGWGVIAVCVGMLVAFGAALLFGKWFGLDLRTSILLGAGTAVCGNSAIMAVAPVVDPDKDDLALSLGVINLLGLLMVFVLPPLGAWLELASTSGGMLAGMTVHAVPQAAAAGEAFGDVGLQIATLYKLLRVGLLLPVVLLVAWFWSRRPVGEGPSQAKAKIPSFLWLFGLAVILRSVGAADAAFALPGVDSQPLWAHLTWLGKFILTAVMAAVGMGIFLPTLVRVGPKILVAATCAAAAMTAACAGMVLWMD